MNFFKILMLDSSRYGSKNFIKTFFIDNRFRAVFFLRLMIFIGRYKIFVFFARLLKTIVLFYGIDTTYKVKIGPGIKIVHLGGIVIHEAAEIGERLTILNNVTIGQSKRNSYRDVPIIHDNVFIGTQCCIIGKIIVGSNVTIGAQTLINKSIEKDSVVYSQKSLITKKQ